MENTESISNLEEVKQDNILVWLDFDAYSYTNFAISSELYKLTESNFIGLVATKQDVDFFQNQKIMPFKKLMYYPDCYINKKSYNMDNLKKYEKEFGLNIWMDVFTERSFYKYWTDLHKPTKEEIFSIIENSIKFFTDVLKKYKPKLLLTQYVGENISNLLLWQIAKSMNIKTLMPLPVNIHDEILITDNLVGREVSNEFIELMKSSQDSIQNYDEGFDPNLEAKTLVQSSYEYGPGSLSQKINHYVNRFSNDPEPIYKNAGKTKWKMFKHKFQNNVELKKRKSFLDDTTQKNIDDERFIYFPLPTEPEARTLTMAPFYSNPIVVVENIAKSIPIDHVLYVKEHPIQKEKGSRPIDTYEKIQNIPNVKLLHPDADSKELIAKSQAIISITGSAGFEGLLNKKPVILFVEEYYDVLSSVTKANSFDELNHKIKSSLHKTQIDEKEISVLLRAIKNQTITVPYWSIIKDAVVLSSIQRYENDFNLTMKSYDNFYKKFNEYFKLMAYTIHSKLEN